MRRCEVRVGNVGKIKRRAGIIGILKPQSRLDSPFFKGTVNVDISCIDILLIPEMIGLRAIDRCDPIDDIEIIRGIIGIHIAALDPGLQLERF